jgi:uncharacterized repeat protein (TIGR02543 family)
MGHARTTRTGTAAAPRRALACLLAAALALSLCGLTPAYGAEVSDALDVAAGVAPQAVTASGDCGPEGNESDVTWSLEDGTLTISGTGDMAYYPNAGVEDPPWYDYRDEIKHVVISTGVLSVGRGAFMNCLSLVSVAMLSTSTSSDEPWIGPSAFRNCTSLVSVGISEDVSGIGSFAFYNCASLASINIPTSVNGIGEWAFSGCSSLLSVDIPESMKSIENHTFSFCTSLASVSIPASMESIDSNAFEGCASLASVSIPASVLTVGHDAFNGCRATIYCEAPSKPVGWDDYWASGHDGLVVWEQASADTAAPVLSASSAARRSASAATVSFTSSEAGSCYWAAAAPGTAVPAIDTTGAAVPLAAGPQALEVGGLATGAAWDVSLVAKDAAGNVGAVLRVPVPAWEYTVAFRGWDGAVLGAVQKVSHGSAALAPKAPVRTGHTFAGWDKPFANVTSDLTVTAKYTANTYAVKFDANGGKAAGKASASVKRAYGQALGSLAKPVRSGYDFLGWYTGKAGGKQISATTKVAKSVTYYAHWRANGPVVTLNANGGKVGKAATASVVKAKGAALGRLATPTRAGYDFQGWYTGKVKGTKVAATVRVTKNVTYYAHWKAKSYTVRLNANGGKVAGKASASTKRAYNTKLGKLSVPKCAGYSFLGWYTSKSGGKKVTSATKVTKAVTLYAHWKRGR